MNIELPIAPTSYQPSTDTLVRAIKRVDAILARTVSDETPLESATVFISPARREIGFANFAADLRLDEKTNPESVLDPIDECFEQAGARCSRFDSVDQHWPDALAQAIGRRGYQPAQRWVYVLSRKPLPDAPSGRVQIIPARAAYTQLRRWYGSVARSQHAGIYADACVDLLDEPRLETFLGRLDGEPVGTCGVVSLGQVGVVHGLHVVTGARGEQIGLSLLTHLIEHCARAQFAQVVVELGEGDARAALFESLGFERVTSFIRYGRT